MMRPLVLLLALLLAASAIVLSVLPAAAMKDPSAVYCGAMGYTYKIAETPDGPLGVCVLPDGKEVESFRFLQGFEGTQYSYCAREGYPQKMVTSYRICGDFGLDQCLVCILPDGTTREVTQVMNLSFAETRCGDGSCGQPEDFVSCPADCRSGGWDTLCDGVRDSICDPDCPAGKSDPDCGASPGFVPEMNYLAGLVILAVLGAGIYLYLVRKRSS